MITQAQLEKFFTKEGSWPSVKGDVGGSDYMLKPNLEDDYTQAASLEAWCNDKYRFETMHVLVDGSQWIFDADLERKIQVSEGAAIKFYKIIREEIKE